MAVTEICKPRTIYFFEKIFFLGKRLRWSTPEKEILQSSTERHLAEGTNPTVPECELLRQENLKILENRSSQAIKAYIYSEVKRSST